MGAKTVKSRSAAGKNKAFNGNFKQGELRSWSISSKNRKRRWHMSLLAQSWRQNTAEAMTTQRWKWSCPSKSRLVKRKGHCLSFFGCSKNFVYWLSACKEKCSEKAKQSVSRKTPRKPHHTVLHHNIALFYVSHQTRAILPKSWPSSFCLLCFLVLKSL